MIISQLRWCISGTRGSRTRNMLNLQLNLAPSCSLPEKTVGGAIGFTPRLYLKLGFRQRLRRIPCGVCNYSDTAGRSNIAIGGRAFRSHLSMRLQNLVALIISNRCCIYQGSRRSKGPRAVMRAMGILAIYLFVPRLDRRRFGR
jgi:hypothetical protein